MFFVLQKTMLKDEISFISSEGILKEVMKGKHQVKPYSSLPG